MEEEGAQPGTGAPDGGSPEGGSGEGKSPKDDVVPKSQFIAALNSAEQKRERELAALRAEFETKLAAATAKPAESVKRYTRAELNAAVAENRITQDQADTEWERQIREDANSNAERIARDTVLTAQRTESVTSQINQYKALAPEILDDSHETRQRIRVEYNELIALGDSPRELSTQLKAIRAVLGPIDKLKASRSGKPDHESHQETGGSGQGRGPEAKLKLTASQRDHYQRGIEAGRYKDWKEVEDELKFARPRKRA